MMIKFEEILLGVTMMIISIFFMVFSVLCYVSVPDNLSILEIIGSLIMLITAIIITVYTLKA